MLVLQPEMQTSNTSLHYSCEKGSNKHMVYITMAILSNMLNLFLAVKHNACSKILVVFHANVYMLMDKSPSYTLFCRLYTLNSCKSANEDVTTQ